IIEKGEMLESGDVTDIIRRVNRQHTLEIRVLDESMLTPAVSDFDIGALAAATPHEGGVAVKAGAAVDHAIEVLHGMQGIEEVKHAGDGRLQVGYTGEPNGEWEVLNTLVQGGVKVLSFGTQATDLEDIFMRVTKGIVS